MNDAPKLNYDRQMGGLRTDRMKRSVSRPPKL